MAVKGVLIDTNAYSAFKSGRPDAIQVLRNSPTLGLSTVVIGELLGGFVLGRHEDRNREELRSFLSLSKVVVYDITPEVAEHYAQIYKRLRKAGTPIPTNDLWIAATALQHDIGVYTYDGHFDRVRGLKVVHSEKDLG